MQLIADDLRNRYIAGEIQMLLLNNNNNNPHYNDFSMLRF